MSTLPVRAPSPARVATDRPPVSGLPARHVHIGQAVSARHQVLLRLQRLYVLHTTDLRPVGERAPVRVCVCVCVCVCVREREREREIYAQAI